MSGVGLGLALTTFAGAATSIGGAIAVARSSPGSRMLAGGLGFSAGVMLYVALVEILAKGTAELVSAHGRVPGHWYAVAAFFGGIALIGLIDRLVPAEINPHEHIGDHRDLAQRARLLRMGLITAAAISLHNVPEGFATFISALHDPSIAIPVAVAIAIHNIPEGIAVALPILQATRSRRRAFWLASLSGLAEPAGALVGYLLLRPFLDATMFGVAFAGVAGIMVFICLDQLLPTAEEYGEHHVAIYGLIAGMGVMAVSLLLFL